MSAELEWKGHHQLRANMMTYADKVRFAILQVAKYWAAVLETYAKENAPWNDITGNARQALHTWVDQSKEETVRLFLSHGVRYGLYLEARFAGAYSIIWPTIEEHLPKIAAMLRGIFS